MPGTGTTYVVQLSPLRWWASHWDSTYGRSRRCGGNICARCAQGAPIVYRFVVLVEVDDQARLMEIPRGSRSLHEALDALPAGGAGAVLAVSREGTDARAAINVAIVSHQPVVPQEILPLVQCLGLPAELLLDVPPPAREPEPPIEEGAPSPIQRIRAERERKLRS